MTSSEVYGKHCNATWYLPRRPTRARHPSNSQRDFLAFFGVSSTATGDDVGEFEAAAAANAGSSATAFDDSPHLEEATAWEATDSDAGTSEEGERSGVDATNGVWDVRRQADEDCSPKHVKTKKATLRQLLMC